MPITKRTEERSMILTFIDQSEKSLVVVVIVGVVVVPVLERERKAMMIDRGAKGDKEVGGTPQHLKISSWETKFICVAPIYYWEVKFIFYT